MVLVLLATRLAAAQPDLMQEQSPDKLQGSPALWRPALWCLGCGQAQLQQTLQGLLLHTGHHLGCPAVLALLAGQLEADVKGLGPPTRGQVQEARKQVGAQQALLHRTCSAALSAPGDGEMGKLWAGQLLGQGSKEGNSSSWRCTWTLLECRRGTEKHHTEGATAALAVWQA